MKSMFILIVSIAGLAGCTMPTGGGSGFGGGDNSGWHFEYPDYQGWIFVTSTKGDSLPDAFGEWTEQTQGDSAYINKRFCAFTIKPGVIEVRREGSYLSEFPIDITVYKDQTRQICQVLHIVLKKNTDYPHPNWKVVFEE